MYETVVPFGSRRFICSNSLDTAEDALLQDMSDVSCDRVQNWIAMSIQMSGGTTGSVTLCIVEMAKV